MPRARADLAPGGRRRAAPRAQLPLAAALVQGRPGRRDGADSLPLKVPRWRDGFVGREAELSRGGEEGPALPHPIAVLDNGTPERPPIQLEIVDERLHPAI